MPVAYSLKLGIIKEYSYISCNYSSNCILQNCHCCQNERYKNSLNVFPKSYAGSSLLAHHLFRCQIDPCRVERKRARGEKTDAHSCYKCLAEAGADHMLLQIGQEERKQVSCFRYTFSAIDPRTMAVIYIGLTAWCISYRCLSPNSSMRESAD